MFFFKKIAILKEVFLLLLFLFICCCFFFVIFNECPRPFLKVLDAAEQHCWNYSFYVKDSSWIQVHSIYKHFLRQYIELPRKNIYLPMILTCIFLQWNLRKKKMEERTSEGQSVLGHWPTVFWKADYQKDHYYMLQSNCKGLKRAGNFDCIFIAKCQRNQDPQ